MIPPKRSPADKQPKNPLEQLRLPSRHPRSKGRSFLALARSSGAWLVTGNLKHFPEKSGSGVTVVSPTEYLDRLLAGGKTPSGVRSTRS
jgi:hypothetical protein